jgi:hypothetical protein
MKSAAFLLSILLLVPAASDATLYVLTPGSSVSIDGDMTNDLTYYTCGATCPAIRSPNGWQYGYNTGISAYSWEQQVHSYAAGGSWIIPTPDGGFGFNMTTGNPLYSNTYETYLVRSSNNSYYKLRLTAIDLSDLNPATIEVVPVPALPSGNLQASMACDGFTLVIRVTSGDGSGTSANTFRATATSGPGLSFGQGHTVPAFAHQVFGGPHTWTGVTVTEEAGDLQSVFLGSISCPTNRDFNSDSKADVIWRYAGGGGNVTWLMSGASVALSAALTPVGDANWKIAAIGDFQRDGKMDIIWRHAVTGDNSIWLMNGTSLAVAAALPSVPDSNWKIAGVGDFQGDGKHDLVWRNQSSGANSIWLMDGTTVAVSAAVTAVPDTTWRIAAVGDLQADGKADLIWRNSSTGSNAAWRMSGVNVSSTSALTPVPDPDWQIAGAGDIQGDGKIDLLWRNVATGNNSVWMMDGFTVAVAASLPAVADTGWKIAAVGDFQGDAKADLIWRHSVSGANSVWLLNGPAVAVSGSLPTVFDAQWEIVPRPAP